MLEPLLMLTVLNCVFMFSSTMTTCALWWQYRRNRNNCPTHGDADAKPNVKKSKSCENKTLKSDGKKNASGKPGNTGNKSVKKKRDKSNPKGSKDGKNEKKDKFLGVLMKGGSQGILMKTNEEGFKTLEKLTSTEDIQLVAPLPSSDAKSTIVMEVSTIQKFMQVLDSDRDTQQSCRKPKGTLTYRISPDTERKVQLIVEDDSAHKMGSVKNE